MIIEFTIRGQPASKSNTSQIVRLGDRVSLGKSKAAKAYERGALPQIPRSARLRLEGPVSVTITIWYADERSDLDASLILDCLQDRWQTTKKDKQGNVIRERMLLQAGVYRNDRQARQQHFFHAIDRANPRALIRIETLTAQQADLALPPRPEDF